MQAYLTTPLFACGEAIPAGRGVLGGYEQRGERLAPLPPGSLVVPPGGFEPPTPGLGNLCSIP